jgi:RNA polymerase sigma factor (sigma-70 family)
VADNIKFYWFKYIEGDNQALGQLYELFFERLVFKAIYYTKNPEVARDIVSGLFVYLIETPKEMRLEKWSKHSQFELLLTTIVKNKCLDYLKSYQVKNIKSTNGLTIEPKLQSENMSSLRKEIDESLQLLKEDERLFFQAHLNGFSNEELAQTFQINEKTVRNRLSLTRKQLAKIWWQSFLIMLWLWN